MPETILIHGGAGGVGSALARALAAKGVPVHLAGRDEAKLRALGEEIGARWSIADVENTDAVARATEEAASGGALGGFAYAVGTINLKPFPKLTVEDFERDFRLNALCGARAFQLALPSLSAAEQGASALLFSSVAVGQGFTAHASISMAKGAVEGLVRALAAELAPKVRVNAIAPSLTQTPLAASLTRSPQVAQAIASLHAIPRLGEAAEIAALGAFLLSPEAGWITGQVIGVDGGRSTLRTKG